MAKKAHVCRNIYNIYKVHPIDLCIFRSSEVFVDVVFKNATGRLTGSPFAFPDTHFVKAVLAILSALRLVARSKHAPRAFDSATWQAGASSDREIHKTNQYARKVN